MASLKLWGGATCFAYQCGLENGQVSQNDTWTFIQELSHSSVEHDWTWPRFCSETWRCDRVHKVSHWIAATIAALDLCRKPDPRGKPGNRGRNKLWVVMGWVAWGCRVKLILSFSNCILLSSSLWFIVGYVMLQYATIIYYMIWHTSTRSFVVDFTSASQGFAVDQWTIVFCFCSCFEFRKFLSTMAVFGVL